MTTRSPLILLAAALAADIHAAAQPLDYLNSVGRSCLQGLSAAPSFPSLGSNLRRDRSLWLGSLAGCCPGLRQQLKYYVLMHFLDGIATGFTNWVAINVLGFGINGSATVHVMRQFLFIGLICAWQPTFTVVSLGDDASRRPCRAPCLPFHDRTERSS